ncbi:hypothetical protein REPUB_Repub07fG0017600 [Reevesia pubescens]
MIIVNKLEKWGETAELLSFHKSPKQDFQATSITKGIDHLDHGSRPKMDKDCCCNCDSDSGSDYDREGGEVNKKLDGITMLGKPSKVDGAPSKWQFPKTPMLDQYGGPRPFYPPFESYHPPVIGRLPSAAAPPYHPYGLMHPPPPYGFFNSRPPPKVNPMIHYTSYADNYSRW